MCIRDRFPHQPPPPHHHRDAGCTHASGQEVRGPPRGDREDGVQVQIRGAVSVAAGGARAGAQRVVAAVKQICGTQTHTYICSEVQHVKHVLSLSLSLSLSRARAREHWSLESRIHTRLNITPPDSTLARVYTQTPPNSMSIMKQAHELTPPALPQPRLTRNNK